VPASVCRASRSVVPNAAAAAPLGLFDRALACQLATLVASLTSA
jgi:hypothetical protein